MTNESEGRLLSGHLHQVALGVSDLAASEAFYAEVLGLRHIATYDPPGLVFFDLDGTRLLLEKGGGNSVLYLWVDDIDTRVRDLEARGVVFIQPPHMIFPDDAGTFGPPGEQEWMAFFTDPAGNTIALATRKRPSA